MPQRAPHLPHPNRSLLILVLLVAQTVHPALFGQSRLAPALEDSLLSIWSSTTAPDSTRLHAIHRVATEGYLRTLPDSALLHAKAQYGFAERVGDHRYMAKALGTIGTAQRLTGKLPEAIASLGQAVVLYKGLGDRAAIAQSLNSLGQARLAQGDPTTAAEDYLQALRIYEQLEDKTSIAGQLLNIGSVYNTMEDRGSAFKYWSRSLELMTELGNKTGMAHGRGNLAIIHWANGDADQALADFRGSLQLFQEIGSDQWVAATRNNIAVILQAQGHYDQAIDQYRDALAFYERMGNLAGVTQCLSNIGTLHQLRGEHARAAAYGERALPMATEAGEAMVMTDIAKLLYNSYKSLGRPARALEMHELYVSLRDSLRSDENQREVMRTQMQYEFEKKELVLQAEQEARDAIAAGEIRRKEMQRNAFIVGLALVLVLALLLAVLAASMAKRRKQESRIATMEVERLEQEKVIAELTVREQVGRDMHDDLGAGLSALRIRGEMAQRTETDPQRKEQFAAMARQAEELVTNMRQLIWTMTTEDGDLRGTVDHCLQYARGYLRDNSLMADLQVLGEIPRTHLAPHQRRNLFLTVKEALHNVVKHAQATHVRIVFEWSGSLSLTISDNGVGISEQLTSSGRGLTNMRKRITELGGSIAFQRENGTQVEIVLPFATPMQEIA